MTVMATPNAVAMFLAAGHDASRAHDGRNRDEHALDVFDLQPELGCCSEVCQVGDRWRVAGDQRRQPRQRDGGRIEGRLREGIGRHLGQDVEYRGIAHCVLHRRVSVDEKAPTA